MTFFKAEIRAVLASALALALACPPARALVSLNDGRDRIYVSASVGVSRDSNVFASADSPGDFVYSTSLSADYTRRAGWIGVNASAGVSSSKFAELDGQDFANPNFSLEFNKQSGRTTGSLSLSASRQSRADAAVNARTTLWAYSAGLGVKYPVAGTWTLSGNFGYNNTLYVGNAPFSDLASYSTGLDVFHVFTSDRDLVGGYRYRFGSTSGDTRYGDHAFNLGISGKIIRGISGSVRAGYQVRTTTGGPNDGVNFGSWTASGSASYAINKKMNISGSIGKDFATTATESFVDTINASLDAQYAITSRWSLNAGLGWSQTSFLGESGRIVIALGPPVEFGPNRVDTYLSFSAGMGYSLNEHFKWSAGYNWFKNWSTLAYADFVRSGYNMNVSTRW